MHVGVVGGSIAGCSAGSDVVQLRLDDGSAPSFDLVLFADGYGSLGRRLLVSRGRAVVSRVRVVRGVLPEVRIRPRHAGAFLKKVSSVFHGGLSIPSQASGAITRRRAAPPAE